MLSTLLSTPVFVNGPRIVPKDSQPFDFFDNLLKATIKYLETNSEESKERIRELYPSIKGKLLQQYYQELLSNPLEGDDNKELTHFKTN